MIQEIILIFSILVLAFMYAAVGHGGASGYLAAMAMVGISPLVMKPSALLLNLGVSLLSFYHYARKGHFKFHLFWPFSLTSIPMAYFGAQWQITDSLYKKILGIALLIALIRLVYKFPEAKENKSIPVHWGLLVGGIIGLFSGMIGIGGGIILSPVIVLFRWAKMKEAAAISALFIFVNSLSGILGVGNLSMIDIQELSYWLGAAIIGGFLGARWGAFLAIPERIKQVLALVLLLASIKLFII